MSDEMKGDKAGKVNKDRAVCGTCPHACSLSPGQTGSCRARMNRDGRIVPVNYGKLTSISMDPIEKKPFARFFPGSMILSVGSFGCSLACPFCQNHEISQAGEGDIPYRTVSPEELADLAMSVRGNLGIAFTYNEPLIAWEYIRDTGKLLKKADPEKK
ncbi:MAG: radical SAM protein, partial [Anaerovoracaceae bacterium]